MQKDSVAVGCCVPEVAVRDLGFLDFLWPQGMELLSPVLGPSSRLSFFVCKRDPSIFRDLRDRWCAKAR